ncbi:response regulator [Gephyromycinifex aptenodytis]|uniref:response regulator n=1 Tax=Gephyromycinifex aptenodytis TaxID=2716227 RepID=UPI001445FCDC|nr:response regulator transcription factor [Gephyromycinifex aptenodytis]
MAIRVLVADDHPMWREAVEKDLIEAGFEVVGTASDGRAALERTRATRPDVLVLDLHLPLLSGAEVVRGLKDAQVETRVLILSASGAAQDVVEVMKEGAVGYLVKSTGREEFLQAVAATSRGEAVFTPEVAGLVLGEYGRLARHDSREPAPELTAREKDVLRFVATGMSYRDIAETLGISHRTVQNHVQNTLGKLQLNNRVQLARYAVAQGLAQDDSVPGAAAGPSSGPAPTRAPR